MVGLSRARCSMLCRSQNGGPALVQFRAFCSVYSRTGAHRTRSNISLHSLEARPASKRGELHRAVHRATPPANIDTAGQIRAAAFVVLRLSKPGVFARL
jgi:hypothetical protein